MKTVRMSSAQTIVSFLLFCICVFFILTTFFVKIRRRIFGSKCEEGGIIDMKTTKFEKVSADNFRRYKRLM